MWALCRADHGLSWDEFCTLTLAQLEALEERREIAIRHQRFNAALITSTLYNINRPADSEPMSAFDFLPGFERDPEAERHARGRQQVKQAIAKAFANLPRNWTRADVLAEKARAVKRMQERGIEDAEQLFREVYPSLCED